LSESYFTNRQDRYYIVQDCEPLADYIEDYINALADVSHKSNNEGNVELNKFFPDPYKSKVKYIHTISQHMKMFKFNNRVKIPIGEVFNLLK